MTMTDSNTQAPQYATLPAVSVAFVVPDLAANVAQAQAAGDLAYEIAQEAGWSLADCADCYHWAYIDTMRGLGTPAACCCAYCQPA